MDEDQIVGEELNKLNTQLKQVGASFQARVTEDGRDWFLISEGTDEQGQKLYHQSPPHTQMGIIKLLRLLTVHMGGSLHEPVNH